MNAGTRTSTETPAYDLEAVRHDFPGLHQKVHGEPLAYLDNAATAQKPSAVIEAVRGHYERDAANVHRGVHTLSQRATQAYEDARGQIQRFVNAAESREIVFVRGATEAVNLIAQSYARPRLRPGDEVLISWLEHHSNIVPWQMVCEQTGAALKVAPIDDAGAVDMEVFERLLSERTKVVAVAHVSNALGTVNPLARMVELARGVGAVVLADGAQAAPHLPIDVRALGVDFYAISGHKMYGPTGIGALYGRAALLEAMPPWQGGGDMIRSVSFEKTLYHELPWKFEAGTPNIAGTIGLGAAAEYLQHLGLEAIGAHEHRVLAHAQARLAEIPQVREIGTVPGKAAVLSFVLDGVHPHDAGTILDQHGIAVRTGHHCAEPVMQRFGVPATIRASFGLYNTVAETDRLAAGVQAVLEVFGA
ncbi:MAG TPA: cysteine desulfurase [Planctomycetota bacterium]